MWTCAYHLMAMSTPHDELTWLPLQVIRIFFAIDQKTGR